MGVQITDIPEEDIVHLLAEHDRPDLIQFGTDRQVALYEDLYNSSGGLPLVPKDGWLIFRRMIELYRTCVSA